MRTVDGLVLAAAVATLALLVARPGEAGAPERGPLLPRSAPTHAVQGLEPPPPPSTPAVTRAEAEAVLAALADAWRREDAQAVERIYDASDALSWRAAHDARKLFQERNAFSLTITTQDERSLPDGGLRLLVAMDLSSRPVREARARREKRRWAIDFARRPDRGVVIAFQTAAEMGLLPAAPPWSEERVGGTVRLQGVAGDARRIALDLELTLRNDSSSPAGEVAFALHPFSSELRARVGGAALEAHRVEASLDAWRVRLPADVAPGESVVLGLSYSLEQPGDVPGAAIGPDAVRLVAASGWLPLVEPPRPDAMPRRRHDLVIVTPSGLEPTMPGARSVEASPGEGLHATRFVAELPSLEVPLVAVRGRREEIRLGPRLVLDIVRREGGGDAALAISHVTSLAAFLEDRLGPCPMTRLGLVEAGSGGFREAPGWMALDTLAIPREDADQFDESRQVFLFLGLSMARLWVLHAGAPTGVGARDVAQGLCEHLAGAWAGAIVKKDIPGRQRDLVLGFAQADPELDRPLLPLVADPTTPPIFRHGKARMVFDMYELLVGPARWRDVLAAWSREAPRGAPIDELVSRMGGTPEREAFVDAFFRRQGASQLSIRDVRLVPLGDEEAARLVLDKDAWKRVEIELDNAGLGPVPVTVRVEVDQALRWERAVIPEYGRLVVAFPAAALPTRIRVDPDRVLWQARSDDDAWPPDRKKKRSELGTIELGGGGDIKDSEIRRSPPR